VELGGCGKLGPFLGLRARDIETVRGKIGTVRIEYLDKQINISYLSSMPAIMQHRYPSLASVDRRMPELLDSSLDMQSIRIQR
jgi:hypothetical protein